MERWTAWVVRLTSHAASAAAEPGVRQRLSGATEDARSLRDALAAAASGELGPERLAMVRSVYALWDANHDSVERLAALVDPVWYRRWRIRTAGARPAADPAEIEPSFTTAG